ncbi:MAG: thiamine-phosphate diphosphorylase [Betaproteobacteria bacterium RIFCSPLOWO2_12_FULL_63_13]|nr:MAG: thiamine-phosphate diphosphorylase [Betaproteobacteria bacterium RIFCSPLOWO2_02_FULL_63_19]OGA51255.1 MAG: thiamine-phosphate diphosphorylase [Betaproteobacteria bacterium RIFCSPLOWO2_12_FULL_63_13]
MAGLYAITPEDPDTHRLAEKLTAAIAGGARLFQYRNKSPDRAARRTQAESLLGLCRDAGATLIVNDDLELALAIGADGVHLGRDDGSVAAARARLGERKLLGVSCYDSIELARAGVAQGADYVAFGSAFASPTKPSAVRAPTALFTQARAELRVPIVAIGGITPENAPIIIEAGADAIAVITAVFGAVDTAAAAAAFCRHFQRGQT